MKKLFAMLILSIGFFVGMQSYASDVGSPPQSTSYIVPGYVMPVQTPALNVDCVTLATVDQEAMYSYKVPILSSQTITAGNDAYFAFIDTHRRMCTGGVDGYNNNIGNSTVRAVLYNTDYGSNTKAKYPLKFLLNKSPC